MRKTRNLSVQCSPCLRIAQDLRQSFHSAMANSGKGQEIAISSRADIAVEKDKTISSSFFKEVTRRSFHVKQQEIYCYHKRKRKEIEYMQSILQKGIKMPHLPLPLLGLTLTDTQDDNTASVRAFISFGSKREFCLSLKLRQLHCFLALLRWLFV